MRLLLFLFCFLKGCLCSKFLVYNPLYAHSHTTFLSKIADTLAEAGHDVTVLLPIVDETLEKKTALKSNAKQVFIKQDPVLRELMHQAHEINKNRWTMSQNPLGYLRMAGNFTLLNERLCEVVGTSTEVLEQLRAEKFDVGIAEPMSICGFGLFEHLEITSSIGAFSCVQAAPISWYLGEPTASSYVPAMIQSEGEKMGLLSRFKNSFVLMVEGLFFHLKFRAEAEVIKRIWGKDYSSNYGDLIGRTSLMFTNANPYLNYPRPLLHKTVEIGGITVDVQKTGALGEKWDKILNERKHTVFISFGSMAKSKDMPKEWKESMLSLFASLPEVTFIWKYEEPSTIADHLPNVHLSSWLPQNALLADPRLSLFITHGGLGSTTEVAHFGKPSIMIPLFADQPRNAAMLARHGGTLTIEKNDLGNPEKLRESVTRILNDPSFAANAAKLAKMLKEQPVSAKDLVVSNAEFVAKYGPLKQLDPYGRKLNILQYYLVDVLTIVFLVLAIVIVALYFVARCILSRICRLFERGVKNDGNNSSENKKEKIQ